MLAEQGRIVPPGSVADVLSDPVAAREARALPIAPRIAVRAQQLASPVSRMDRPLAAAALEHAAPRVGADAGMRRVAGLKGV
ncbi:MAG: hypothetical protein ACK5TK_06845 [Betaproteobacteria bacterium]